MRNDEGGGPFVATYSYPNSAVCTCTAWFKAKEPNSDHTYYTLSCDYLDGGDGDPGCGNLEYINKEYIYTPYEIRLFTGAQEDEKMFFK